MQNDAETWYIQNNWSNKYWISVSQYLIEGHRFASVCTYTTYLLNLILSTAEGTGHECLYTIL